MPKTLLQKARANRATALLNAKLRKETNVHSLDEARKRRQDFDLPQLVFVSCRTARRAA